MAGDWNPVRIDLFRSREVLAIARRTGRSRHEVGGLLVDFWGWAGSETVDGLLARLTCEDVCETVGGDLAFWQAVAAEQWLEILPDGLRIPNFDRWLSNGAKSRLQKNKRQAAWRTGKRSHVQPVDVAVDAAASTATSTTEEENEEERGVPTGPPTSDEAGPRSSPPRGAGGPSSVSVDWDRAKEQAKKIHGRCWPTTAKPLSPQDRRLILETAALLQGGPLPEAAIWEAVESTENDKPKNPGAYLTRCLANQAHDRGLSLPDLRSLANVPEDLLLRNGKKTTCPHN